MRFFHAAGIVTSLALAARLVLGLGECKGTKTFCYNTLNPIARAHTLQRRSAEPDDDWRCRDGDRDCERRRRYDERRRRDDDDRRCRDGDRDCERRRRDREEARKRWNRRFRREYIRLQEYNRDVHHGNFYNANAADAQAAVNIFLLGYQWQAEQQNNEEAFSMGFYNDTSKYLYKCDQGQLYAIAPCYTCVQNPDPFEDDWCHITSRYWTSQLESQMAAFCIVPGSTGTCQKLYDNIQVY